MDHISKTGAKRRTKKKTLHLDNKEVIKSVPAPRAASIRRGRISKQNNPYKDEQEQIIQKKNKTKNEEKVYYLDEERQFLNASLQKYGNLESSMGIKITTKNKI
jgi:hypothetical protein